MSLIYPPNEQPVPDPVTGQVITGVMCNICGKTWNQGSTDPQPCMHTQDEMDTYFASQPSGPEQRQRWKVVNPPVVLTK